MAAHTLKRFSQAWIILRIQKNGQMRGTLCDVVNSFSRRHADKTAAPRTHFQLDETGLNRDKKNQTFVVVILAICTNLFLMFLFLMMVFLILIKLGQLFKFKHH